MIEKRVKKKRSSLSKQLVAVIVLGAICLGLAVTLIAVNVGSDYRKFPFEGETYYIVRQKDAEGNTVYIMADSDKNPLAKSPDSDYFVSKKGTLIAIDQKTGKAKEYIRPDTEGNEELGINDRVLMFPYTPKKNVQSIEISNGTGDFAFYRMRVYEDTDKVSYSCMRRDGGYILLDENGQIFSKGSDGYYTLASGNKIAVNESTGAIYTHTYYDLDGKLYNVKKNGDKYSLYLGNKEITEKIERSETRKTDTGEEYTHTFYSYFITSFGTLVSVDAENGTLSVCAVREYDSKGEKYTPYYFILRSGKYMLSDKDGNITEAAIDDPSYYGTGNHAYIAFNEANGSYSVRIRKNYYIVADNDGKYSLLFKGEPVNSNGSGFYAVNDTTYVSFDEKTGSYSLLEFDGNEYKETESKTLDAKVYTDAEGEFVIEGFETTAYDASLFASLVSSAGYTITSSGGKLTDPIKLPSGKIDFSAYGLTECIRKDSAGNEYVYTPASYVLTDMQGNVHRVTVGDKIVSNAGYYMMYESWDGKGNFTPREAVYIRLDNQSTGYTSSYEIFYYYSISDTLLAPLEGLITPMALYPIDTNSYFDVTDFTLMVYNELKSEDTLLNDDPEDDEKYYDTLLSFSYISAAERQNTALSNFPYLMDKRCQLYGYEINSYSVDSCLMSLADLDIIRVSHLGVDDQDLVRYGLDIAKYMIYFEHSKVVNNEGENSQMILISALTPNDTYYVYSQLYDMIVEVNRASLQFLNWKTTDWVTSDFYAVDMGFCDNIKVESGSYWANFDVNMTHNFTATVKTSGSSNFYHRVIASDDKSAHLLTIGSKIFGNVTTAATDTDLISVDFDTLENYYKYKQNKSHLKNLTPSQLASLNAFIDEILEEEPDGKDLTAACGYSYSDTSGREITVFVYFIFDGTGELSVLVSVDNEAPSLVFSRNAYNAYEKMMFSDPDVTEGEKREALDFYFSSNVSTNVTNDFEEIVATNSDGSKTVYTKEKIVRTYKDGRVVTDYGLGNDYKVFFDVGEDDLVGVSKSWVRFYDVGSKEVENGGYKEIKDATYSFESSLVRYIVVYEDGTNEVVNEGTLGKGKFKVTVTSDMVVVTDEKGNVTRYLRYTGTQPFSSFYSSLLWASYEGFCDIPEADKKAFRESDDSTCQMKLTINTKIGTQYVYRTYQYSERRAYITANGEGDFFVMRSFIDKIINASKTIFEGNNIDPKDKY